MAFSAACLMVAAPPRNRTCTVSLDTLIARTLLTSEEPASPPDAVALVLMGGGARTAYQAGVMQALARLLQPSPDDPLKSGPFPFRWLLGTSAGAMGVAFLSGRAEQGTLALHEMPSFWRDLRSDLVYRIDAPRWVKANRLLAGLTLARQVRRHRALLDSMPLVDTLHRAIDLSGIERNLNAGHIDAVGVTASSYTSGEHWTFCQIGNHAKERPWHRPGRRASFELITIEHLMASGAIPFLFPSVPLWVNGHKEHFGDGSMRQLSPLSPAIHFGARRILAVGVGQPQRAGLTMARGAPDPTAGTIAGHAMASVFHDTLLTDVEQTQRVSQTLRQLPADLAAALPYRPVDVVALQPSISLDELASKHIQSLPASTRNTLIGLGALDTRQGAAGSAASLASYLLFEPDFINALIELGESDTWRRKDEVLALFGRSQPREHRAAVP